MRKNNQSIISKPHAHLHSMQKTSAKFQNIPWKTVRGVAPTRYPVYFHLKGYGMTEQQTGQIQYRPHFFKAGQYLLFKSKMKAGKEKYFDEIECCSFHPIVYVCIALGCYSTILSTFLFYLVNVPLQSVFVTIRNVLVLLCSLKR